MFLRIRLHKLRAGDFAAVRNFGVAICEQRVSKVDGAGAEFVQSDAA
jgi:hypothetical protein